MRHFPKNNTPNFCVRGPTMAQRHTCQDPRQLSVRTHQSHPEVVYPKQKLSLLERERERGRQCNWPSLHSPWGRVLEKGPKVVGRNDNLRKLSVVEGKHGDTEGKSQKQTYFPDLPGASSDFFLKHHTYPSPPWKTVGVSCEYKKHRKDDFQGHKWKSFSNLLRVCVSVSLLSYNLMSFFFFF